MSDGVVKSGVQFDPQENIGYRYTEQELDYDGPDSLRVTGAEALSGVDQSPTDRGAAKVRTYDVAANAAALIAQEPVVSFGKVRVTSLPAVLNSVTVTYNKSAGDGESLHPVSQMAFSITKSGSGEVSPKASAQASAAILPIISYDIDNWFADALVNAEFYEFYVASGTSIATILTRIGGGVLDLPVFKKKTHQVKLLGEQVSLRQSADSTARLGFDSATPTSSQQLSYEYGSEQSTEVGVSVHVDSIPESIHGSITIASATDSIGASITVKANTVALEEDGSIVVAAITNEPTSLDFTVVGSVSPTGFSATVPADVPRTGKYLVDLQRSLGPFGVVHLVGVVVNFTQYA